MSIAEMQAVEIANTRSGLMTAVLLLRPGYDAILQIK